MSKKTGSSLTYPRSRKKAKLESKLENKQNEKIVKSTKITDNILAVLFVLILGLIPLVTHAKISFFVAPRIISPIVDTGFQVNLFTYYKWLLVIVITIVALILLFDKISLQKYIIRTSYINGPLLILVILVLASIITAEFKSIALFGLYNQGDGALILLAYFALLLVSANTTFPPWFDKVVNAVLIIFVILNTVIALASFSGHDLLQLSSIRKIFASNEINPYLQGSFTSTMNHDNYVSGFSGGLFAYFMGSALLQEKTWKKMIFSFTVLASFILVLASLSSSGFITILVVLPLLVLILMRCKNRKSSFSILALITIGCIFIFLIMNTVNPRVGRETMGLFAMRPIPNEINMNQLIEKCVPHKLMQLAEVVSSTDARQTNAEPIVDFQLPKPAYSAGSGRIYIWRETMKLVIARPLLGYGLGTLAYYFPQNDINKVANLKDYGAIVTKPHNTYIAIAFGLGLPALVAFFTLLLSHFFYSVKRVWQAVKLDSSHAFQVSLFLFFCAFIIQALVNDTVIDAGAVFWTLFGISVSLNSEEDQP